MYLRRCYLWLTVCAVCVVLGCESHPPYREPALSPDQAVTLKGERIYMTLVDGMSVGSAFVKHGRGSNSVVVAPGWHELEALHYDAGAYQDRFYYWPFRLECVAGRTYVFEPQSLPDHLLRVTDTTTGKSLTIRMGD